MRGVNESLWLFGMLSRVQDYRRREYQLSIIDRRRSRSISRSIERRRCKLLFSFSFSFLSFALFLSLFFPSRAQLSLNYRYVKLSYRAEMRRCILSTILSEKISRRSPTSRDDRLTIHTTSLRVPSWRIDYRIHSEISKRRNSHAIPREASSE